MAEARLMGEDVPIGDESALEDGQGYQAVGVHAGHGQKSAIRRFAMGAVLVGVVGVVAYIGSLGLHSPPAPTLNSDLEADPEFEALYQRELEGGYISKKSMAEFDKLETKVKAIIADSKQLNGLWHNIDSNGNSIVSLAEIDKLAVEKFPLLNHKPALMRAYKATLKAGNDDGGVRKREFKSLLANMFYFNKLWWLFGQVDGGDRRLTFPEFKKLLTITGVKMSDSHAQADFRQVDKNRGGMVSFDEFCAYFAAKSCPESLQALVE